MNYSAATIQKLINLSLVVFNKLPLAAGFDERSYQCVHLKKEGAIAIYTIRHTIRRGKENEGVHWHQDPLDNLNAAEVDNFALHSISDKENNLSILFFSNDELTKLYGYICKCK